MNRNEAVEEARKKLIDLVETLSADDFERLVTKFFGSLVIVEAHFKRRFPVEHAKWEKEYYGED